MNTQKSVRNIALALTLAGFMLLPATSPAIAQDTTDAQKVVQRTHELLQIAVNLRGLDFQGNLPVEVVSRERMFEIVKGELDQQVTPEYDKKTSALFGLLGLMPPGSSFRKAYESMIQDQAAGLYDPKGKKFYVVNMNLGDILGGMLGSMGKTAGNLSDQVLKSLGVDVAGQLFDITAVHELTHAIDDQHYDIETHMERLENADSDDAALAYQCVCEGDANRIMIDYVGSIGLDKSMLEGMTGSSIRAMEGMMGYDPFVERLSIAPYFLGETFVNYVYNNRGADGLVDIFTNPPSSMEQVIHPERYELVPDLPSTVANPDLSKALPGWKLDAKSTMGEFVISFMFETKLGATLAEQVADGWDGDRITTWRAPNGDVAGAWVTVWDDETQAREFYTNYLDLLEKRYNDLGIWQKRDADKAVYTGAGRAAAVEITGNTVCIAEGVPQDKVKACMSNLWKTKVNFVK
jgi:hypothetical protein